jgi:hypothetical protein
MQATGMNTFKLPRCKTWGKAKRRFQRMPLTTQTDCVYFAHFTDLVYNILHQSQIPFLTADESKNLHNLYRRRRLHQSLQPFGSERRSLSR